MKVIFYYVLKLFKFYMMLLPPSVNKINIKPCAKNYIIYVVVNFRIPHDHIAWWVGVKETTVKYYKHLQWWVVEYDNITVQYKGLINNNRN